MILFEDIRKAPTIDIKNILGDKVFNEVYLVGETNGYNIINLYGISPKTIVYCHLKHSYYFFKSISYTSSKKLLQKNILSYIDRCSNDTLDYYKSYVNRNVSYEYNYYKPLSALLCKCDNLWRINKWNRIMFSKELPKDKQKNPIIISNGIGQLYDYLYDSNIVLKQIDNYSSYLLDILNMKDYKNKLFIFTPLSFLRGHISFDDYELLLSTIDKIEKSGGYTILIDDLSYGKKFNILLEIHAKMFKRNSAIKKYNHSETMVLTNL